MRTTISLLLMSLLLCQVGCRLTQTVSSQLPSTLATPISQDAAHRITTASSNSIAVNISDTDRAAVTAPIRQTSAPRQLTPALPVTASKSPILLVAHQSDAASKSLQPMGSVQLFDQGGSPSDLIKPTAKPEVIAADPAAMPGGPRYPKQATDHWGAFPPAPSMTIGQCDACGGNGSCGPQSCGPQGGPLAAGNCSNNWRPEGISCPWPSDEYLCDGGDNEARVRVSGDWTVNGLDLEDTVAHYDTQDGRIVVEPSNKVCLYAPRFQAVRRVDSIHSDDQHVKANGFNRPIGPKRVEENQLVGTDSQPIAPIGEASRKRVTIYDGQDRGLPVTQNINLRAAQDRIKAAGDFDNLCAHRLDENLKPFLAKQAQAALLWTKNQTVQAVIEGRKAWAEQSTQSVEVTYRVDTGKPRLRVVKAVSTSSANTGETIEFVLRFDNIGEQTIGNVTLIDSLTTRLEYVPDSQQCSLKARFLTTENHGESSILRWEIEEPIKAGDGGVIVFKCKVR